MSCSLNRTTETHSKLQAKIRFLLRPSWPVGADMNRNSWANTMSKTLFLLLAGHTLYTNVSRNGLLFRLNISPKAKLNSLLFLIALRDSVRSKAKIVVVVRKLSAQQLSCTWGFFSPKVNFHRCTPGKIDQNWVFRIRTTSYCEAAITSDEAVRSLALSLWALALKLL